MAAHYYRLRPPEHRLKAQSLSTANLVLMLFSHLIGLHFLEVMNGIP